MDRDVRLDDQDRAVLAAAGVRGAASLTPLDGGFANTMLRVHDGATTVVLRRFTRGADAAVTELAALREAAADGIPVPEVLAAHGSRAVLSFVDGVPASVALAGCGPEDAERIGACVGAAFAGVWRRARPVAGLAVPGADPLAFAPWERPPRAEFADLLAAAVHAPPGWAEFAARYAPEMDGFLERPVRSHSDANPKNVLLRRTDGDGWAVAALVDWEYTCAAPAEHDLGNLLRFEPHGAPLGPFGRGVVRGAGADAAAVTRGRCLDLLPLAEMFARPGFDRRAPTLLAALRGVAEGQLAAGTVGGAAC